MRYALMTFVIAAALGPAAGDDNVAEKPKPARIPAVNSLVALREVPPAWTIGDWELRLGLAEGGPEAGPWKLLYCHCRYVGKDAGGRGHISKTDRRYSGAAWLGPLSVTLEGADWSAQRSVEQFKTIDSAGRPDTERLYVHFLEAWQKGDWVARVWSPKLKLIAESRFSVAQPLRWPWMRAVGGQVVDELAEEGKKGYPLRSGPEPRKPEMDREPVWSARSDRQVKLPKPIKGKAGYLPGALPPGPMWDPAAYGGKPPALRERAVAYPLKAFLEGKTIVLQAGAALLTEPDENVLLRWWVNGKAVGVDVAKLPQVIEKSLRAAARMPVKQLRFAISLPRYLGPLAAGDRVEVQFLYCDSGTERVFSRPAAGHALEKAVLLRDPPAPRGPLLSNRAAFRVTRELLDARPPAKGD